MSRRIFRNEVSDEELFSLIEFLKNRARRNFRRVCVLMGGESEEREISIKTGEAVLEALRARGYDIFGIVFPSPDFIDKVREVDAVFLALHGRLGEDGTFQGFFEVMKKPYTSADHVVSALFMDKSIVRRIPIFRHPKFEIARSYEEATGKAKFFELPMIIKPSFSGSSFGVNLVKQKEEIEDAIKDAFRYSSTILIEEFLDGPELTVGVLEGKALGVMEIRPKGREIFSLSAKYVGETEYLIPPVSAPQEVLEELLFFSSMVCNQFGVDGAVRFDFRLKSGIPYFLELNTIPGMTGRSLLPKIAQWRGIDFEDLVEAILGTARLKAHKR